MCAQHIAKFTVQLVGLIAISWIYWVPWKHHNYTPLFGWSSNVNNSFNPIIIVIEWRSNNKASTQILFNLSRSPVKCQLFQLVYICTRIWFTFDWDLFLGPFAHMILQWLYTSKPHTNFLFFSCTAHRLPPISNSCCARKLMFFTSRYPNNKFTTQFFL